MHNDKRLDKAGNKSDMVCPWWLAYSFDNKLRGLIHNPQKILGAYVKKGMRVLDVGCGLGFFSLAMAEMVGRDGVVVSADVQQQMLNILSKRAKKRGVVDRIQPHLCKGTSLGLSEPVDFALACWMVHETPDYLAFFKDMYQYLKPNAGFLVMEPKLHCSNRIMALEKKCAEEAGFIVQDGGKIALSHAMLLIKPEIE